TQSIDIFQLNSWIDLMNTFPQYVPDEILALLKEISIDEKHQILQVVNELGSGKISEPTNIDGALALIKNRTPQLFTRLQKINATFSEQFDKLRPATRNKVLEWGKLLFQNFNKKFDNEIKAKMQPLKVVSSILNSYKQQSKKLKDDLRSVFPKIVALFESDFLKLVMTQMQLQLSVAQLLKPG
ncbi:hypothetical protein PFISCL1PPCAC_9762, partial [Pristionchus fissidentatus]